MLLNYIKIAFRNLLRHKVYSIINILGLAIGMACAILLLLFVRDELSYDKHNSKYERIYMVKTHLKIANMEHYGMESPLLLGQALKTEYSAVEEYTRICRSNRMYFINSQGEVIGEDGIFFADQSIFKVFDHKFIYGSPVEALDAPHTIVLSKSLSNKYFGDQNPVGKMLSSNNGAGYIVKGVFEDLPRNSLKRYNALISTQDLSEAIGMDAFTMASNSFSAIIAPIYTYILLSENSKLEDISKDHERFREKYIAKSLPSSSDVYEPMFQRLTDVYLHTQPYPNSPINILQRGYILTALALFILIIACINYMNLATARSAGRAREVGVRKVLGADRASLIGQFLCESIIVTVIAMLMALVMIELSFPAFNNLAGKELSFGAAGRAGQFLNILIVTLLVGIAAGSYPAFVLSSFLPIKVLRGGLKSGSDKGMFRKTFVVIQHVVSIAMIISTLLLIKQMSYIRNMDLGFNKKDILLINSRNKEDQKSFPVLKKNLLEYSGILTAARSSETGGNTGRFSTSCEIEDSNGKFREKVSGIVLVDHEFIDLMEMKVLEGRAFNKDLESDQAEAVLVNETLIEEMGWRDWPIGKRIRLEGSDKNVIGVLKDFQFQGLHEKIMPMIMILSEGTSSLDPNLSVLSIKIRPEDSNKTIEFIKKKWLELNPMRPLEITFMEDLFNKQYRTEDAASRIFICSAFLGIFISCLGMFGLSSFIAGNKAKEIGVRKVFGASIWSIVSSLSLNFLLLVLIASIIACPIAYYTMSKWLENFAHNTEMSWWLFVGSICMALIIAFATVSYHAVKAALTDPVKALRYE